MTSPAKANKPLLSNEDQLWLMQQVKLNVMTIEEAVTWTKNRENELRNQQQMQAGKDRTIDSPRHAGRAKNALKVWLNKKPAKKHENERTSVSSAEDSQDALSSFLQDLKNKKIYNFSVYKCVKNKNPQKRILQVDYDGKLISLILRGNIMKNYPFASFVCVDGQEGKKVFLYFDDSQELEINTENLVDKTKLIRLLNIISEQNDHEERGQPFDPCEKLQLSFRPIKEGLLEKKSAYAAMGWNKRLIVIRAGELAYYRVDEEEQAAALNIIHLSPGSIAINAEDSNAFTIATTKESHRFRLPDCGALDYNQERIRDEWIQAIQDGCKRHYQDTSSDEDDLEIVCDEPRDSFVVMFEELEKIKRHLQNSANDSVSDGVRTKLADLQKILNDLRQNPSRPTSIAPRGDSQKSSLSSNKSRSDSRSSSERGSQKGSRKGSESDRKSSVGSGIGPSASAGVDRTNVIAQSAQTEPPLNEDLKANVTAAVPRPNRGTINNRPLIPNGLNAAQAVNNNADQLDCNSTPPLVSIPESQKAENRNGQLAPQNEASIPSPAVSVQLKEPNNDALPTGISETPVDASNAEPKAAAGFPPPPPPLVASTVPPPPPPVGIPPPPPPPPLAKQSSKDTIQMRPFHWTVVPKNLISKSIWKNTEDLSSQINLEELQQLFKVSNDKKLGNVAESTPSRVMILPMEAPKKKATESFLDHKTAQNLGIFMAGFKLRGAELAGKLLILSEEAGGISTEHLLGLKKLCPEPEMKQLYAKFEGREEELAKEDRFMSELCNIPRLSTRLDILTTIREFPNEIETLQPEIRLALSACQELLESKRFETILAYILAVANQINVSNTKGTTKGIKISSLQKTCVMRTNDRKQTFLQVVLKIVKKHSPKALLLHEEMTSLSKGQSYSTKGLLAEIDIMRKSAFKVHKNCDVLKRKKNQPSKEDLAFCSEVEAALLSLESDITQMNDSCLEIKRTLQKVLIKFGESPDTDSQDLFACVREFLDNFKKNLPPP